MAEFFGWADQERTASEIMGSLQEELRANGSASLWALLTTLGVTAQLWEAPLRQGELRRDDEEMMYWTATGVSVRAVYDVVVPDALVGLLG